MSGPRGAGRQTGGALVSTADRRRIGVLVLVLGLLAAVVIPVATGRAIPGAPQAVPVPGPPAAGDCVGEKFDPAWDVLAVTAGGYRYPELGVGDCRLAHYGEVVALITRPTAPRIDVDPDGRVTSIEDDNIGLCQVAAGRYLRADGAADGSAPLYGYWSRSGFVPAVALTPTARQRAAGQHWLACATFLSNLSDVGQRSLVGYRGTVRNAGTTGVGRDQFGNCPAEVDWNEATSSSCIEPHRGEIFGSAGLSRSVARSVLVSSCAALVRQVTRRAGIGVDDGLTVDVQATLMNSQVVQGPTIPKDSSLQCGVVTAGSRLLKGSLLAIGTDRIPWA